MFNMIGNLMLSQNLVDPCSEMVCELYAAMEGSTECLGRPNVSYLFPWLRRFDLQGLRKKVDRDLGKALEITTGLVKKHVEERLQEKGRSERRNDLLDVMVDFKDNGKDEPTKLSEHQISVFLLEMVFSGTETISTTVEWAMSEILQNPETMIKIKAELHKVVGANKKFEESNIDDLHYLQATVEEALRLHPLHPLVIPRKATCDTNFMGYNIPKDTQVFVNAWAIRRDPKCLDDPSSFKPERFLGSSIWYKGQNFEFIPFGAGRRICPGLPLAHRVLPLILGTLLHQFDWELPKNVTSETMDMTESMGIIARKLKPLKAIPKRSMA